MLELGVAGKVALVTGAGSGIGQASAVLLAQEQLKVAILDREEDTLRDTVQAIAHAGGEALPLAADVAQPGDMQHAVERIVARWGRLDIVFANAGVNGVWAPIEELTPEEWDRTLNINLKGTFLTIKYAAPYLKRQGGSVIVTASVNGTRVFSNTGATAYSCSKAGQVALTKMLALEFAQHRVRVNVICPGAIETNISERTEQRDLEHVRIPVQYPEGVAPLQSGSAEQVARAVLFLASEAADHISGTELWIDAGGSLLRG
jgi:NAD(P)-dependent dehydrogenase (short-subunit alcohol dehydrogenase family)